MPMRDLWSFATIGAVVAASLFVFSASRAQINESGDLSIELIDPKVLRVCADPNNLPFSNEREEGFENRIARLVSRDLDRADLQIRYPKAAE